LTLIPVECPFATSKTTHGLSPLQSVNISCWLWHNCTVWYIQWLLRSEGLPDVSWFWLLTATGLGSYNQSSIKPLHELRHADFCIDHVRAVTGRTDGHRGDEGCCT